jgi:hypothetical protein
MMVMMMGSAAIKTKEMGTKTKNWQTQVKREEVIIRQREEE